MEQENFKIVLLVIVLTDSLYDIRIKWVTKKVKQLFKLKSKNPHPSYVVYEGTYVFKET